jgi:isochorismate synthase
MQLWQDIAMVYAGAGVTRYSDPQQEWEETEMKCNTMLDVLQQ